MVKVLGLDVTDEFTQCVSWLEFQVQTKGKERLLVNDLLEITFGVGILLKELSPQEKGREDRPRDI